MMKLPQTALIVDDEDTIRYILTLCLEEMGYKCVDVDSGQAALDRVASQEFQLAVLDVKMPGISGFEVMKGIRAAYADTCIVMISALKHPDIAARAITTLGADAFIAKPWRVGELRETIQRAVQRRAAALVRRQPVAV
jgi:two-component system response regulator AtoC